MCHSVWAVSRQKLASQLSETKLRKVDRTVVARGVTFQAVVRQKRSLFKCQCIYTKVLTEGTVFNVSYVEMGPSFLRAQRYPRHRMSSRLSGKGLIRADIACVAGAWKQWAKERTGAREGDTRGVSPSRAPVFSCAHYFQAPSTQARADMNLGNPSGKADALAIRHW